VIFYPLDPESGSGINFFPYPGSLIWPLLFEKFSYINFTILVMLSSTWATLKTYSRNRKQQEKCMFIAGSGIKHSGSAILVLVNKIIPYL
jgi:hypothetical protein